MSPGMPDLSSSLTASTLPIRLWVVPHNDGEAVEIVRLLASAGESCLITHQPHGATWEGLEPELRERLGRLRISDPGCRILGVELAGPNRYGASNIDHHSYSDDDRTNPLSSLEQCAALLGIALDRHQRLVAINDRAWIPGLEAAGATPQEIERVRQQDLVAQGLGPADRAQAETDLQSALWHGRLALVRCPRGSNSYHNDLLYGRADESLLMGPNVWSYSGPRHHQLASLGFPEKYWSGGSPVHGYFGIERPSPASRERIIRQLCGEVPEALATSA